MHFIRWVLGDGTISVLNENFDAGDSLAYEYVWATCRYKTGTITDLLSGETQKRQGLSWFISAIDKDVKIFEVGFSNTKSVNDVMDLVRYAHNRKNVSY